MHCTPLSLQAKARTRVASPLIHARLSALNDSRSAIHTQPAPLVPHPSHIWPQASIDGRRVLSGVTQSSGRSIEQSSDNGVLFHALRYRPAPIRHGFALTAIVPPVIPALTASAPSDLTHPAQRASSPSPRGGLAPLPSPVQTGLA